MADEKKDVRDDPYVSIFSGCITFVIFVGAAFALGWLARGWLT